MLHQRKAAVDACTTLLRQAETSNDLAAADAAECYAALLRARIDNRLPIAVGAEMVSGMFRAVEAQQRAREVMMAAHLTAPQVIADMGLTRMYGDVSECPPTENNRHTAAAEVVRIAAAA